MSHTTKKGNTIFIHNGSYKGNVNISNSTSEIDIEFDELLDFVVDYIKQEKIAEVEQMNTSELIKSLKL